MSFGAMEKPELMRLQNTAKTTHSHNCRTKQEHNPLVLLASLPPTALGAGSASDDEEASAPAVTADDMPEPFTGSDYEKAYNVPSSDFNFS